MPRPGTPVIHPQMLDRVRPVVATAQTGRCQLLHPSDEQGQFDPVTASYAPPEPDVLWEGGCRVTPISRLQQPADAAGAEVTVTDYQVTVSIAAPPVAVGDLVRVLASADPQLVGRRLRITTVAYGDLQAERHLTCQRED